MKYFRPTIIAIVVFPICLPATFSEGQETINLFNGVDLTGWSTLGGTGSFDVVSGESGPEIRGVSSDTSQNTFLVTDASYDDFILELDFKIDQPAGGPSYNSGVQIRSQSLPSHNNGRVFGYQVEIDPSERAWSGGIYFEGGSPDRPAGWLDDLSDNQSARDAFLLNQWNHFRVHAEGNRIRTWINDVSAVDYTDDDSEALLSSGFIGLQVHSVTNGSMEVRFRNLVLEVINNSPADLNGDGFIDYIDYGILMQGMFVMPLGELPGDLTGDSYIDFADHCLFQSYYEIANGNGSFEAILRTVPEPGYCSLVFMAAISIVPSREFRHATRKRPQPRHTTSCLDESPMNCYGPTSGLLLMIHIWTN